MSAIEVTVDDFRGDKARLQQQEEEEEKEEARTHNSTRKALIRLRESMRDVHKQPEDDEKPQDDSADSEKNTLSFEDLTVLVPASGWSACNCRDSPLKYYASEYLGVAVERQEEFFAIQGISGHIAVGEILLVLASNETASSTLIRALTGRLSSQTQDPLTGSVFWNGVPIDSSKELQGWRRMAPYVSARDDSHSAVLTVRETLQFAAECMGGPEMSTTLLNERVDNLLQALGLDHVAETVVGDENLRGVSGGQKRRVTVGEMLVNPESVFFGLENISDGLASTDSFDIIKKISESCEVMGKCAVISLMQPSDEIVALFDKLLVLTEDGETAYFGPVDRSMLRRVFLGPDADLSQDAGSICDLVLGQARDTSSGTTAKERFQSLQLHEDMVRELAQIRNSAKERSLKPYIPATKYSSPWYRQMNIIARRRLKLIWRNPVTYTRACIAILFAIVIGSLFSELENDLIGSLSRTGYLFLNCFLVLMLSAAITIPQTFRDRITLFKHRSAEFYSGRVAYVTQVLLDMPLSILEAVILASISYYWVDMKAGANHFFLFTGVLIGLEFVGQAFGRLLCAVSRKQVSANAWSSVLILFFATVAGFMPAYQAIPSVFRWLSWITPVSYAFESIMLNEFAGRTIFAAVVASPNGTVTLGEFPGEAWLGNFDLPRRDWNDLDTIKVFDVLFLFLLSLVFDVGGFIFVELTREWYFNRTRRPQRIARSMEFSLQEKAPLISDKSGEQVEKPAESTTSHWPQALSIEDLSYFVPLKNKMAAEKLNLQSIFGPCLVRLARKKRGESSQTLDDVSELQLLQNVVGRFRSSRMTALMGTSGAGKTTLLDVIAGYKTAGREAGTIMIDGKVKEIGLWKSISGYAEQQDVINPYLSTLETLRFTAACRLRPRNREAAVEEVIRLMGLEHWQHVVVGREAEEEGLPKHARKRLTIAIQLVTKPRILFCDEPTTGLGTHAANLVMGAIRRVTDELKLITVATIHQPSKTIWDSFDDLLLLVKGGNQAYMGDIKNCVSYFEKLSGRQAPALINPADFVLSAVQGLSIDDVSKAFQESEMKRQLEYSIASDKNSSSEVYETIVSKQLEEAKSGRNVLKEIVLLFQRHFLTQWRNPSYSFMRLSASIGVSLYMAILFYSDKSILQGAVLSIGAIFFLVFVLVIPMQASVVPLIEDRAVLYREATSGLYTRFSYGLGQLYADLPFHAINAVLMFVCFYFIVGFRLEGELMGYFVLMLFLANWSVMSLSQLFAYAAPNEESANGLSGLAVILSVILMGFLITVSAMPDRWEWAYWANLYHYIIQGLVTNELAENTYKLNLLESGGSPTDATTAFVPEPGTDLSTGSTALQAAAFLNLALLAGPGTNVAFSEQSTIGAIANLVECLIENDCLGEDASRGLLQCTVLFRAPCADELEAAMDALDIEEILKCFDPSQGGNSTLEPTSDGGGIRGVPSSFTEESLEQMSGSDRLELALCLLRALLPDSVIEIIETLLELFKTLLNVILFVVNIVENGINIPGELILFVFGWADLEDGQFDAPYKWFYALTSVAIFIGGLEIMKLLTVSFLVWTKR